MYIPNVQAIANEERRNLRDKFAMEAMKKLVGFDDFDGVATSSYEIADAMLKARDKKETK